MDETDTPKNDPIELLADAASHFDLAAKTASGAVGETLARSVASLAEGLSLVSKAMTQLFEQRLGH